MIDGQESNDQRRMRVGLIVLVLGILLVLWAGGSWAYRQQPDPNLQSALIGDGAPMEPAKAASALRWFLVVGMIIVLFALFGSYVLLRVSRRYREAAGRDRAPPTHYEDAWSMHKAPDDEL